MGWAEARAELVNILQGASISDPYAETLTAREWPPRVELGRAELPVAYVIPPRMHDLPQVNGIVVTEIGAVTVRFLLHDRDPEAAAKRMEGWRTKLRELLSDNLTLNGTLQGSIVDWDFTEFSTFGRDGAPPYGFDLEIRIPLGLVASVARGA